MIWDTKNMCFWEICRYVVIYNYLVSLLMRVKKIELKDYKRFKHVTIELKKDAKLIIGSSVFPGVVAIKVNMGYSGIGKTYNPQ